VEKRYSHQFLTIDYAAAVGFYEANKFTMWGEKEEESDTEDNQKDGKRGGRSSVILMTILLSMNTRSSMRLRLMFKARMTARIFGMTVAIPKTTMMSRKMRRSEEGIKTLFILLRH